MTVGYEWIRNHFGLDALPPRRPARVSPVTRVEHFADHVAVPASVAPTEGADVLEHFLFALKHEPVQLAILMEGMRHVPAERIASTFRQTPSGAYARLAGFFWEASNGRMLEDIPASTGAVVDVFDASRFVVGQDQRNARWRVNFNGLGTLTYCATVEKTPAIQEAMQRAVLARANHVLADMDPTIRDRALEWAYLSETRGSFEIEGETPGASKQAAFVRVLQQAHLREPLTEDYLSALQNTAISNPLQQAASFRHQQNHLAKAHRGAAAVTYVPPPPELARELMDALMKWSNHHLDGVDPLVAAAVVSFGFVFIHPFMDGNGRLSRFLLHQTLCRAGALKNGLILPISVAMKKHEAEYLDALQAFSRPMREKWDVRWIDGEQFEYQYLGDRHYDAYRYWDATPAAEFCMKMAELALDEELRNETEFLLRYDLAHRAVDDAYDLVNSDLAVLLIGAFQNNGVVSKRRRAQFQHRVPEAAFDFIEDRVKAALATEHVDFDGTGDEPAAMTPH
ncbi:Fic family protein [Stenotrophomonas sp. 278]|uniref:Fic family protein n=1 Tax=Stenotrophomonas sp. 278 TaxID=2479851 RepID=UPI000F6730ED|nr:Fic family protein [Stenotrophomonas sp. 278]RRU17803.1 Fic family protein [Stenotrophomonas sp. 278]